MMLRIKRFLSHFQLWRGRQSRYFELDEGLSSVIKELATQEKRSKDEFQTDLISAGLAQHNSNNEVRERWDSLSSHERDVAALTCLGYINRQIVANLKISPDTVKGYVRQVLVKFNLHGKNELRTLLSAWDFSDWEP